MTSRERVREAITHRAVDRTPRDIWAEPGVFTRLEEYFGVGTEEDIRRKLGIDMRWLNPDYIGPARVFPDGSVADHFGIRRKAVTYQGGSYEEIVYHPLAAFDSTTDIANYALPDLEWWDYSSIRKKMEEANSDGEVWVGVGASSIFERAWNLRGLEKFLSDLALNPSFACSIMDMLNEFYLEQTKRILEAGNGRIDMVYTADDIGTQRGLMISYPMWKKYIYPRQKKFNEAIKKYGVKIFYHSCGSIYPIINDLIEMGVDILNPLQQSAKDMEAERLQNDFGGRISFHGGIDVQQFLPSATKEEVENEVRRLVQILGKKGGYIIAPAHNIQVDTPVENILTIYNLEE